MGTIHLLDKNTIDQIAAGESIERPANVAKELVENAIDAGALAVTVDIKNGGISYLRVTDDGSGIEPEDIKTAFMRHATSKISEARDLDSIVSLGFRGEALSSIAAVSRVELITKTADSLSGRRYCIEGGEEIADEDIGAPDGTTIIVRDLFFNTPARQKFLKSTMTEGARIGSYIELLALSNPDIAFRFIVNGQTRLSTSGNGSLKDIIYSIYGKSIAAELLEINDDTEGIRIRGFIAKPAVFRKNRNFENYFVNGRYVKSKVVARAIEEGFRLKLMQHSYPFTCFMLEIDPEKVDVNVHPTKMEVRFSDEKAIYDFISETIRETLANREMIVDAGMEKHKRPAFDNDNIAPFEHVYREEQLKLQKSGPKQKINSFEPIELDTRTTDETNRETKSNYVEGHESKDPDYSMGENVFSQHPGADIEKVAIKNKRQTVSGMYGLPEDSKDYMQQELIAEDNDYGFLSKEAAHERKIIGQVFDTYWIVQFRSEMMIIDQHAAHEKVLFEKLMKEYGDSKIISQNLMPPVVFTFGSRERAIVEEHLNAFAALGFELEPFGDSEYKMSTVPYNLSIADPKIMFLDILDTIEDEKNVRDLETYVHRIATEACKAAVKGGGRLSVNEAKELIDELMELDDPYHCPHGRPTMIRYTKQQLEKKFGRIVP